MLSSSHRQRLSLSSRRFEQQLVIDANEHVPEAAISQQMLSLSTEARVDTLLNSQQL
jgi:hypothetical protein